MVQVLAHKVIKMVVDKVILVKEEVVVHITRATRDAMELVKSFAVMQRVQLERTGAPEGGA